MIDYSAEAANAASNHDIHDFVNGQKDCRNGMPHKDGHGESYDAGYSFQYELEQITGEIRGRQH